jgi:hypothetical protein
MARDASRTRQKTNDLEMPRLTKAVKERILEALNRHIRRRMESSHPEAVEH